MIIFWLLNKKKSKFSCVLTKNAVNLRLLNKNYEIMTTLKSRVIGVDVSKEQTTCAIVDVRGNIIAKDSFPTTDYSEISKFVDVLCERILELAINNGGIETIRSVGVSVPSGNYKTGCIENPPNMTWKGSVPLSAMMRDRLGMAVAVGNDSHVIALGEHMFYGAHGFKEFAIVTIGHGLGNAFFSKNSIHLGANGFAGELGHTCVADKGRQCECGLQGCLETYVAAKGIVRTAKELMAESDEPSMLRDFAGFTPRDITYCCDSGDKLAIEVYRRTGYLLGIGLANFAAICDPEAIILTGGIVKAGKWLMEPTQQSFNEHLFHNLRGKVRLIASASSSRDRDVLGASALAWEVKEYSLFK